MKTIHLLTDRVCSIFRKEYSFLAVYIPFCLYFTIILNLKLITDIYGILFKSVEPFPYTFVSSPPLMLFLALSCVFIFFTSKFIFKAAAVIFLLTGSLVNYYSFMLGVIFDYDMLVNILQTHPGEAFSYVNSSVIIAFIVSGVIPSVLLIFIRIRYPKGIIRGFFVRLVYTGCCAILFLAILNHYYQYYSFISRSNNYLRFEIIPYNYVYFGYKAFYNLYLKKEMPFTVIGGDAKIIRHSDKPTLAVVVIGESARAQNFKFSGYHRDTTPYKRW